MSQDRIDQLERLASLRDAGALSAAEFEAEKARVLGASGPAPSSSPPAGRRTGAFPGRNGWLWLGLGVLAVLLALVGLVWLDRGDRSAPVVHDGDRGVPAAPTPVPPSPPQAALPASTVAPAPSGARPVPPKITGEWRTYRTRIRDGWGSAPDFADRYVIIRFGCGAGCTFGIVGDHQTGDLYDLGLGGEEQMYLNLEYGNASNRIRARWDDYENCIAQDFTWNGSRLIPVAGPQVKPRGEEPCDMSY